MDNRPKSNPPQAASSSSSSRVDDNVLFHRDMQGNRTANANNPEAKPRPDPLPTAAIPMHTAEILKEMTCSSCGNLPAPSPRESKVKICEAGHICCMSCNQGNDTCSWESSEYRPTSTFYSITCLKRLQDVKIPFYNFLLNKARFRCPNQSSGCEETPLGENYDKHVAECAFGDPTMANGFA